MVPYSWIVGFQIQATLQSSAKTPQQTALSLYFWLKKNVASKKLCFFPGIEYGNSIDVLATSSNTVLMSKRVLLLTDVNLEKCQRNMAMFGVNESSGKDF